MGHVATLATLLLLKFWSTLGSDEDLYIGCYAIHKGYSIGSHLSFEECSEKCNTNYIALTSSKECLCGDDFAWSVPFEGDCQDCEKTIKLCPYKIYYVRKINLALRKPTKQSSDYYSFTSNLAVDGNKDSNFDNGKSCSHTGNSDNPWFAVDLGSTYKIEKVVITNRNDYYGYRLKGFKVLLTNESFDSWGESTNVDALNVVLCNQYTEETQYVITLEVKCQNPDIPSRFAAVTLPRGTRENIAICEIEVFERAQKPDLRSPCIKGKTRERHWSACIDINECDENTPDALFPGRCNLTTTKCINFDGGYKCDCISNGFQPITNDLLNCIDIDECNTTGHICDYETTICVNKFGSYDCLCKNGFSRKNNYACEDINECLDGRCDGNTTECTNVVGSYHCKCRSGFENSDESDTSSCTDINECNTTNSCPSTGYCMNIPGSYICYSNDGQVITTTNHTLYAMYGIIVIFLVLIVSMAYIIYRRVKRSKNQTDITSEKEIVVDLVDMNTNPGSDF